MKNYKYLLLDFDNTLFDFDRAEETAFYAAFSASGLEANPDVYAMYHEINDLLWKKLEHGEVQRDRLKTLRFEQLLERMSLPNPLEVSHRVAGEYLYQLEEQSFLFPGAADVCRTLRERFRLYIITNGNLSVQQKHYRSTGIDLCTDDIFVSEAMGCAKPSAEYFTEVMKRVGDTDPAQYLVIGDSLSSDIAGAHAANMDAVWLDRKGKGDTQGHPVVHILQDIRELPDYLLK